MTSIFALIGQREEAPLAMVAFGPDHNVDGNATAHFASFAKYSFGFALILDSQPEQQSE